MVLVDLWIYKNEWDSFAGCVIVYMFVFVHKSPTFQPVASVPLVSDNTLPVVLLFMSKSNYFKVFFHQCLNHWETGLAQYCLYRANYSILWCKMFIYVSTFSFNKAWKLALLYLCYNYNYVGFLKIFLSHFDSNVEYFWDFKANCS